MRHSGGNQAREDLRMRGANMPLRFRQHDETIRQREVAAAKQMTTREVKAPEQF